MFMTKREFLARLSTALDKNRYGDKNRLLHGYEAYFAQKVSDGYSESEVCALLQAPETIAGSASPKRLSRAEKAYLKLTVLLLRALMGFLLLVMLLMGMLIISVVLSLLYAGAGFLLGLNPFFMFRHFAPVFRDYWSGALIGLSLISLSALTAAGGAYYLALVRQSLACFQRFIENLLSAKKGGVLQPPLSLNPDISRRANRKLRSACYLSLAFFALCLVTGYFSAALEVKSLLIWRAWNWFV